MTVLGEHILAIDTATEHCSVALRYGGEVQQRSVQGAREHTQHLLSFVTELLAAAGTGLSSLDGILVGLGPGSFTGVRVAASCAQGLALGSDVPVFGLSTLAGVAGECLSHASAPAGRWLVANDARMGEVFLAAYDFDGRQLTEISAPDLVSPEEIVLEHVECVLGTALSAYADRIDSRAFFGRGGKALSLPPTAAGLLAAHAAGVPVQALPAEGFEPLYVRNRVAEKSR